MSSPAPVPPGRTGSTRRRAWWGDRGVSTKIVTAVAAAGIVAVIVGVTGIAALGSSAAATEDLYEGNLAGVSALDDMVLTVQQARTQLSDVLIDPDRDESEELLHGLADLQVRYHAAADAYLAAGPDAEQWARLEEAGISADQYFENAETLIGPAAIASDYDAFHELNETQGSPVAQQAQDALAELAASEDADAADVARDAHAAYENQRLLALILLVGGVALALAIGLAVARGVARGVGRVNDVAQALADGDLTKPSGLTTRDELGQVGAALDAAATTTATVAKLGDSSAEIGNVVKVITSIAEQTNLLALNATIEAARAGEAGKGFAVVANEVEELAQETAKATEEISSIVARISDRQTTIASAVEEQTATTNEMSRMAAELRTSVGRFSY